MAADWRRDYADYKRRNRLIDFNDMERYSVQLLDLEEVARDIRKSTRLVLVDEFQDCSPIEIRLFDRLSEIVEESVWVGDTKQSIYGFRGSNAEMIETVTQQFSEDAAQPNAAGCFRTSLPKSYRSREKLVRAANAVFTPIFGPAAALEPHHGEEGVESVPPLELWQVGGDFFEGVADGVEALIRLGWLRVILRSLPDAMTRSMRWPARCATGNPRGNRRNGHRRLPRGAAARGVAQLRGVAR
ncbi:MAG: UvrD-helicase domain-containing protein [Alistipes shahii]